MRIAIISDAIPPVTDGVTRTMCELATTLEEERIDFLFVSAVEPHASLPWRHRVHVVPSMPLFFYPDYRLGLPFGRDLNRVLDRFAPDVVHVVSPSLLAIHAARYAERRGIPAVGSFHTDFASCLPFYNLAVLEGLAWKCVRSLYNRFAATFAPSRYVATTLRERGIHNVKLWRRGVDRRVFSPRHRSDELLRRIGEERAPVLLFVGRLCREKNLPFLVDAVNELTDRGARFRLVLVGDGPLRQELEARLPQAHFTGVVCGPELSRWYASADLFVFPSRIETFGNVVLEAFASGLPVVAVAAGGVREIVTDGWDGSLVSPHDPVAFADAVDRLLVRADERARLGRNARLTSRRYRWPDVNGGLVKEYGRLSQRRLPEDARVEREGEVSQRGALANGGGAPTWSRSPLQPRYGDRMRARPDPDMEPEPARGGVVDA